MKNVLSALCIGSIMFVTASCATTAQIDAIERKTNDLSLKVDAFEKKYSDVLKENSTLKNKLQGQIPLARTESHGVVFEAMKAHRDGDRVIIDVTLTNNRENDMPIFIKCYNGQETDYFITVSDETGNKLKVIKINNYSVSEYKDLKQLLYSKSPFKIQITVEKVPTSSQYIGVVGFGKIWDTSDKKDFDYDYNTPTFSVALKNIKID